MTASKVKPAEMTDLEATIGRRSAATAADRGETSDDLEAWPLPLARIRKSGAILAANASALALLRRFGPAHVGVNLFAVIGEAAPALFLSLRRLGPGEFHRATALGPDGLQLSFSARCAESGDVNIALGDEGPAGRAETEAHRWRARFAAVADWSPRSAIYALDEHGRVAGWSRSAERFERISAVEAAGAPFGSILARCDFPGDADAMLEAARLDGESERSGWRRAFGASTIWTSVTVRAVRRPNRELDGFVVVARDMTTTSGREAELRRLAETDPLTGLLNRRAFFETARAAHSTARREGAETLSAIAIDLDGFKTLNDRHGHGAGDRALKSLSDIALGALRSGDIVGRLGGDEFAIILPRTDLDRAMAVAERLREAVERLRIGGEEGEPRVTASFGVATGGDGEETIERTLSRADVALYRAKRAGRNRVAAA